MCRENRDLLIILLAALLLASVLGALRAEEPGPWYLISEAELRSIEQYRKTSETEKQTLLLQAGELKTRAGNSETRSARLEAESASLNRQLAQLREERRRSAQSFNGLEAAWSAALALKNGEIAGLKLETEKYKGKARARLIAAIALGGAWLAFFAFKICRALRLV